MLSNIKMELSKADRINIIRDTVKKAIDAKKQYMPKKTYTTFKDKFDDRYSSKAKLIKLYNEVNKINENVKTLKDIKTIKQEEKKMIEQGRYKLKKFLKDNQQAVSFYATVYLPSNSKNTPNTCLLYTSPSPRD